MVARTCEVYLPVKKKIHEQAYFFLLYRYISLSLENKKKIDKNNAKSVFILQMIKVQQQQQKVSILNYVKNIMCVNSKIFV